MTQTDKWTHADEARTLRNKQNKDKKSKSNASTKATDFRSESRAKIHPDEAYQ